MELKLSSEGFVPAASPMGPAPTATSATWFEPTSTRVCELLAFPPVVQPTERSPASKSPLISDGFEARLAGSWCGENGPGCGSPQAASTAARAAMRTETPEGRKHASTLPGLQ